MDEASRNKQLASSGGAGMLYIQSGEGEMYMEVPRPDGECDYVPAEPGLAFKPLPGGKFIAVRDLAEAEARRDLGSHEKYFEGLRQSNDPKKVRQTLKRQDALERQLSQLVVDRVTPAAISAEIVTDEQFQTLVAGYATEKAQGAKDVDCSFLPVTAYQHKLLKRDGTVIRPLFQGEIGIRPNGTIVCLQPGYGTGQSVQVK